jgi:glycosyltransferase involved in cell wall biosynthesis
MNIAFFSESYKPYLSGVTNSIETLKKGLEGLGHKVIVFSPDYPGAQQIPGVYRFPSLPAPYPGYRLTIPVPGKYYEELKQAGINIIHSHSPYQLGLLSMSYARKLKVPFVFTMHTILGKYMHYVPLIPDQLLDFISSKYIKGFCNRCDCVVVPTEKVKQQISSIGVEARTEIVPTGVDLSLFESADPSGVRQRHGIPDGAKLLLFAGRLAKEKNLTFLFKAFESILSKHSDAYLLLAAGGPMENELKKMAPKNTIFAGEIKYPGILDYYAASDVFVFSSLSETQGLVLVEAMASGIPQVAVDAEGVSDVVRDGITGYLTPPSIEAFSSRVLDLLDDQDLWLSMSKASKDAAKSAYSKEVFAQKIELIYKSVI